MRSRATRRAVHAGRFSGARALGLGLAGAGLLALSGCPRADGGQALPGWAQPQSTQPQGPAGRWVRTFEDEFGGRALDPARWGVGFGWGRFNGNGWAGGCAEAANVTVRRGLLLLRARPGLPADPECRRAGKRSSVAAVNTRGRFEQEHGYFEARLRAARGPGLLSAFWGKRADERWPPEIDVMEVRGGAPGEVAVTLHWPGPPDLAPRHETQTVRPPGGTGGFHVYGVEWTPQHVTSFLDGVAQVRFTREDAVGAQRGPFYLMLNVEVGQDPREGWVGVPDATTPWGDATTLTADWVRVWRRVR